jgi:sulfatase maturation enzyme AslB (radical SAM superfamily)
MTHWCPLPFKHVFLEPRGVKPCCSYTQTYAGEITEWVVSDELAELQQQTLNGVVPEGCKYCVNAEERDGTGTRLGALQQYGTEQYKHTDINYVDYRSSNLCNFRCRSCEPFFSNRIAQETRKHPELLNYYPGDASVFKRPDGKIAPTTTNDKQWVLDNLHKLDRLMFTGGEPTRIPEVREIIQHIVDQQLDTIEVIMITNGSFTDTWWFDITKQIPRMNWTISIDAVGPAAELIRDGTNWDLVSSNTERLFSIANSVNIGTVITNLNLYKLGELFDWCNMLEDKYAHLSNGRTHHIEICNMPENMTPYNWPDTMKPTVLANLAAISKKHMQPKQQEIVNALSAGIRRTPYNPELWHSHLECNMLLDKVRNQDFLIHTMPLDE